MMVVWRYELVLHTVVRDCLFEVCGALIVQDVNCRRLVLVSEPVKDVLICLDH